MRIAIDGVQSTGKTTLHQALRAWLGRDFLMIPEGSRVIAPSMGVTTPEGWMDLLRDPNRLREFFNQLKLWQYTQEQSGNSFIVDSSFFLHEAYRNYFDVSDVDFLDNRYDLILFCPTASVQFTPDGFRFDLGREEVERRYLQIIAEHHRGAFASLTGGPDRLKAALEEIRGCFSSS